MPMAIASPQAHQVGAHADQTHQQEGAQCRQRHHHRHNQRGAKLAEEQKQQDNDQYRRFQQGAFHRATARSISVLRS